ncbi:hypothetical protein NPS70_08550 [Streptomyces sp. C10-9-1]|uniref:hypothetical protein n=1 Tax=Streptomyces sp. C10-9-1 TaxID=1859285 RepID=UPI002111EA44|nr:hypothetical protein [Streptomyces sp. C10-9-1]MCQ6553240.1 hypothetical protein [Streptomyces sp. C10-9-1]
MPTPPDPVAPEGPGGAPGPGDDQHLDAPAAPYGRLVRIAYLVLQPALGAHRAVIASHTLAQRALPGRRSGADGYGQSRVRLVRYCLAALRRPWTTAGLPLVLGLRMAPRMGGADELAAARALSLLPPEARAVLALAAVDALPAPEAAGVLARAGVADPLPAVRATSGPAALADAGRILQAAEFDPVQVRLHPTDLLRRRALTRTAAVALAACLLGTAALWGAGDRPAGPAAGPPGRAAPQALDAAALRTAPLDRWDRTARLDFTAWPPRGERRGDRRLLQRALDAWAGTADGPRVRTSAAADTGAQAPAEPPSLLFADRLDGADVVLLHDGTRLARYTETGGADAPELHLARTDRADVTTAAAVALTRSARGTRYLLAPWIARTGVRDLREPGAATRPVGVRGGVTAPVPAPPAGGPCVSWPVLVLRSSTRIAERHGFLLTDLGGLTPVHLTHTPPPGSGAPARRPREALSPSALTSWARGACTLRGLRDQGVRAVNDWVFARQDLPEGAGPAAWVCTRADTWQGRGEVAVRFRLPGSGPGTPGRVVARARDTAACTHFDRHVAAGTRWRSPGGNWFVLAAGSRGTVRLDLGGGLDTTVAGTTAAVAAAAGTPVAVTARLADGTRTGPPR